MGTNPPGSSNALIYSVGNVARFCAQVLSQHDNGTLKAKLLKANAEKIGGLVKADAEFRQKAKDAIKARSELKPCTQDKAALGVNKGGSCVAVGAQSGAQGAALVMGA